MSKSSRIKHELTDLSPQSVCNVFRFLDNLLENELLDFEYFKTQATNHSVGEQYFIFKYGKEYFNDGVNSYLNRWLKNQDVLHESNIDNKFFDSIGTNCHKIIDYIENNEKTIERRFQLNKKYNFEFNYGFASAIPDRIPLYFKYRKDNKTIAKNNLKHFKQKTYEIVKDLMDKEKFELFFNNSFTFKNNVYNIEPLNIEIDNFGLLYSRIYDLYKFYSEDRRLALQEYVKHYNVELEKLSETKKKFYVRKKFEDVGRFEFMKIMYNCFPQVRDTYIKSKLKNTGLELHTYLKTQSRNIKRL